VTRLKLLFKRVFNRLSERCEDVGWADHCADQAGLISVSQVILLGHKDHSNQHIAIFTDQLSISGLSNVA